MLADVVPNHVITADGRRLSARAAGRARPARGPVDARAQDGAVPRRVRRAGIPRRLGLEGLPEDGRGLRHRASARDCGSRTGSSSRSSRPSTKAETGHDENISFEQMAETRGRRTARPSCATSASTLYARARAHAEKRGHHPRRHQVRVRHRATAASSGSTRPSRPTRRASGRATRYAPGRAQPSFDKQYVRDYLETLAWDKRPPGPPLPEDVVTRTREKYVEAYARLTGTTLGGRDETSGGSGGGR